MRLSSWKIMGMSDYEIQCEMLRDVMEAREKQAIMNKSMSIEDTLEQRGSVYGEFSEQVKCVDAITNAMIDCSCANGREPTGEEMVEWHYLAIKLARIAVNPDHTDSYHDLAGYATLMERERMK